MSINPLSNCPGYVLDWEYRAIIRKLAQYGLKPSGNKSSDKMKLHQIEVREAKKEDEVTSKFLTVGKGEQEKIQEKKEEKKEIENPQAIQDNQLGQHLLGQQILLAINLKKKLK